MGKFACCGCDGAAEFCALLAQVGVVGGCLGVGNLVVDFPGGVAFEAAHDFAFSFCPPRCVWPRSPWFVGRKPRGPGQPGTGHVGVAVAASEETVTGGLA